MPIIDRNVEAPTRNMLGHAIRGELDELAALIQSIRGDQYKRALGALQAIAAYIAVDVSGRWPGDADVHEIARLVEERETELPLDRADVYSYLSGAALGFRPISEAFDTDAAAATLPVLITASMLFTFRPKEQKWWTYLDQIWSAYEAAQSVELSVLPALQVRTEMQKTILGRSAELA